MLNAKLKQRKQKILELLGQGHVAPAILAELETINQEETEVAGQQKEALAKIVKSIIQHHITIQMLLSVDHDGKPLFDQNELAAAVESSTSITQTGTKRRAKEAQDREKQDGLLLFEVKGNAGPSKKVYKGAQLPKIYPKSFKTAFNGFNEAQVRETLLSKWQAEGSEETKTYLDSGAGKEQVKQLVAYIVDGLDSADGPVNSPDQLT